MTDYFVRKAYGYILKKTRINLDIKQETLSNNCLIHRNKISGAENGNIELTSAEREILASKLDNPTLVYYPSYSIEKLAEKAKTRFQHEKDAAKFFINSLEKQDIEDFKVLYRLYRRDAQNQRFESMIILDNYIHTKIIENYSNSSCKNEATIYREQYIEFFKNWVGELRFNILLQQDNIHFKIFDSIINKSYSQLITAIEQHLKHTLNDLEIIRTFLINN